MPVSGYKSLWAVNYWAWDGSSREINYVTGDVIESLQTDFIYAFWEDEDLIDNFQAITGVSPTKIDSTRRATEEEERAFNSGWNACHDNNNESYGHLD